MRESEIRIPQTVCSNLRGYEKLLSVFNCYLNPLLRDGSAVIDFSQNNWFDANLLAIVCAYTDYGENNNINSSYRNNKNTKLGEILTRNGFAKTCFSGDYRPHNHESVVPFKIFRAKSTYQFGDYIDEEIVRYFPSMDDDVKHALSNYIQELFGNAQIHGGCKFVYTCGQYYPKKHKMDFTIVNLGTTIGENVSTYLDELYQEIPDNKIAWAIEPEHSTKRIITGGIGLSLMRDFVFHNEGKYQIVSGNEFWELKNRTVQQCSFENSFPGTIINIEIDQNDDNYYQFYQSRNQTNLF